MTETEAPAPDTIVSQAETAVARGAWSDAYALLRQANAGSALAADDEILASEGTAAAAAGATAAGEPRTVTLKGIRDPLAVVTIDWR